MINILLGLGIGTAMAAWNRSRPAQQVKLMAIGALGACFASLDEITLWSRFDDTLGTWLGLEESGVEIFMGTHWYSHQAFMHSILANVLFSTLLLLGMGLVYYKILKGAPSLSSAINYVSVYALTFGLSYFVHLLGDLAAPSGPWHGIQLFFPMEVHVGGWGMTWWWNNYDLSLVLGVVLILNLALIKWIPPLKKGMRYLPACVCGFALLLISWQLSTRGYDFNKEGYATREKASHHIQEEILGHKIHTMMAKFDEKMPFYY
ncbi:MAG: metal-dependent hydrolase [Bacteroidia bacterium]|nr:metal-dependent hydrolase [Bacteroidia bacterium]